MTDDPNVIVKRVKAAKVLRAVLYGGHEVRVCNARIDCVWAWTVREFVMLRDFRYSELLDEARRFVSLYGHVDPLPAGSPEKEVLDLDLELVKAFERYMRSRRTELETWRKRPAECLTQQQILEGIATVEAKRLSLLGICPICGGDLPCEPCKLPAVQIDGRGGIVAV